MMRRIFASQPEVFRNDITTLEKLVRFQHFSLPTRLMDVTWNPLVALCFCVKDLSSYDGEVVVIGCNPKKSKFFDSDTVSCLSNLCYLKGVERNILRKKISLPEIQFNQLSQVTRLVSFIKPEKPYFTGSINPSDLNQSVLVRPKQSNQRILAQNGAFIVFGLNSNIEDESAQESFKIIKFVVSSKNKGEILNQLDILGFNDESMFPELESAAKYITRRFSRS